MSPPPGFVLAVDKPEGPTSHDVVDAARRALGVRRVGHTGTLDPFASGLLVLCVGPATRLAEYLSALDKTYDATAVLGVRTDTLDREGETIEVHSGWESLTTIDAERALAAFAGAHDQVPPQFSAKKVKGEAMHRRARRGEHVELEPRPVTIHEIDLVDLVLPEVRFRVRCSSGTYVRAVARDLGDALGVGAHLTSLRRTAVGRIGVEHALALAELDDPAAVEAGRIEPLDALAHLPSVTVDRAGAARLSHGQKVPTAGGIPPGLVAVSTEGRLVAVAEAAAGMLRPRKVFAG